MSIKGTIFKPSRRAEKDFLKFKLSVRMEKNGDLNDFECILVLKAGLSVSESASLWDFHTQPFV